MPLEMEARLEEDKTKRETAARRAADDAKFDYLEALLMSQREAHLEKHKTKREAAEKSAGKTADAKKRGRQGKTG
jgi:hypothetical protein